MLGELAHGHGYAGVVPVALGRHAAGPDHQEDAFQRLLQRVDDVDVVKEPGAVLGSAVGVVTELAGVDQVELADVEVGHRTGDGAHVSLVFRTDDDDADVRHAHGIGLNYLVLWVRMAIY